MYHAAPWSSPSSTNGRYRTTHHQRTKQRGKEDWTWEDILDGKGSYTWEEIQAGRDRLPWEQPGERRQQEKGTGDTREHCWQGSPRGSCPPKNVGGTQEVWQSQVGDLSHLPVLTVAIMGLVTPSLFSMATAATPANMHYFYLIIIKVEENFEVYRCD